MVVNVKSLAELNIQLNVEVRAFAATCHSCLMDEHPGLRDEADETERSRRTRDPVSFPRCWFPTSYSARYPIALAAPRSVNCRSGTCCLSPTRTSLVRAAHRGVSSPQSSQKRRIRATPTRSLSSARTGTRCATAEEGADASPQHVWATMTPCSGCAEAGASRCSALSPPPPPRTALSHSLAQVEKELEKICRELLDVLERFLLPEDKTAEGQVFYWKMAGDYWRYLAEFATGDDRKAKAEKAKEKYEQATKTAVDQGLPPTNPIRLGLALNYSVFFYEILNLPQVRAWQRRACLWRLSNVSPSLPGCNPLRQQ